VAGHVVSPGVVALDGVERCAWEELVRAGFHTRHEGNPVSIRCYGRDSFIGKGRGLAKSTPSGMLVVEKLPALSRRARRELDRDRRGQAGRDLGRYVANKVDSAYEYRAIDWETGELVARWLFPDDSVLWNNWGGITTLLDDGDLLLGGFFAVKRYDVGHLR